MCSRAAPKPINNMTTQNLSLAPGSWVLVTGANGYIASHIIDVLLDLGFNVRGTARDEKPWLDQFFEARYGKHRYETVVVPVIEADNALDAAMDGMAGVIHGVWWLLSRVPRPFPDLELTYSPILGF